MASFFLLLAPLVPVAHAVFYNLSTGIPANIDASGTPSPAGIIVNLFQFGMVFAGVLAFAMVVYAGVKYGLSRGNPTGQADARDRIIQAFLGILLLSGAYLILYTLNPGLTRLQLPTLESINASSTVPIDVDFEGGLDVDPGGTGTGLGANGLLATGGCAANLSQCANIQDATGITCHARNNACLVDQNLARIITCALQKTSRDAKTLTANSGYSVSSTYHTGSDNHCDPRHYTGCAVDLVFTSTPSCDSVNTFNAALVACGGGSTRVTENEYTRCNPAYTGNRAGDNIHVRGCNNIVAPPLPPYATGPNCRKH